MVWDFRFKFEVEISGSLHDPCLSLTFPIITVLLSPPHCSINFVKFVDALRFVSNRLRTSLNVIMEKLVLVGSPVLYDNSSPTV